jgi:hypothetical protein
MPTPPSPRSRDRPELPAHVCTLWRGYRQPLQGLQHVGHRRKSAGDAVPLGKCNRSGRRRTKAAPVVVVRRPASGIGQRSNGEGRLGKGRTGDGVCACKRPPRHLCRCSIAHVCEERRQHRGHVQRTLALASSACQCQDTQRLSFIGNPCRTAPRLESLLPSPTTIAISVRATPLGPWRCGSTAVGRRPEGGGCGSVGLTASIAGVTGGGATYHTSLSGTRVQFRDSARAITRHSTKSRRRLRSWDECGRRAEDGSHCNASR